MRYAYCTLLELQTTITMNKFSAYRIFEENGQSAGRFVELSLDDLDLGEVVIMTH